MKRLIAAICMLASLTGCGDSDEDKAKVIAGEVRSTWDSVMPFEPGYRQTGIASFNKEFVVACSTKMTEASAKLGTLEAQYSTTDVWKSEKTAVLNKAVNRWKSTCNELKQKQGW